MKTQSFRATLCGLLLLGLFALPLYAQETEAPETEAPETEQAMETDQAAEQAMETSPTIIATLQEAGSFSTLLTALDTAGLTEALQAEGPFTLFAPTDAAFAELGEDKLAALLKPENKDKLVTILTYHVVEGQATASDAAESLSTLEGNDVQVMANDDGLMVNDAQVIQADIEASNGVIHAIDTVLMPPKDKAKSEEKM